MLIMAYPSYFIRFVLASPGYCTTWPILLSDRSSSGTSSYRSLSWSAVRLNWRILTMSTTKNPDVQRTGIVSSEGLQKIKTLKCVSGRCQGVVAATNLDNACRNVISHVLVPGAPKKLRGHLKEVKQNLQRLIWNTDTFVWHLERVLNLLHAGKHRGKNYSLGINQRGGNLPASYRGVFCCGYGCAP